MRKNGPSEPATTQDYPKLNSDKTALDKELPRVHEVWFAKRVSNDAAQSLGIGKKVISLTYEKASAYPRRSVSKK